MLNSLSEHRPVDQCWNRIGVAGDRTCSQLSDVIHCRNCCQFSAASQMLLERPAPQEYQDEWAKLLAQEMTYAASNPHANTLVSSPPEHEPHLSVIIFRLEDTWLALPAADIQEVTTPCPIHSLPHHQNSILKGIVSIRGEILMFISLAQLLGISAIGSQSQSNQSNDPTVVDFVLGSSQWSSVVYPRMIVVMGGQERWVCQVDEIYSVQRIPQQQLQALSGKRTDTLQAFTQGIIKWHANINYLDPLRLIDAIYRRLQ